MTPERKNEIWAMLTQKEKEDFQGMYELKGSNFDKGYNAALDEIFGKHNLTAQAEEKPKFKPGDKVFYEYGVYEIECKTGKNHYALKGLSIDVHEACLTLYTEPKVKNDENSVSPYLKRTNPTENGISDSKIQSESAESVETSANSQVGIHISSSGEMTIRHDIYQQYRLDLAKEIAVALINNSNRNNRYGDILAHDAVKITNEIVKRLKETEE